MARSNYRQTGGIPPKGRPRRFLRPGLAFLLVLAVTGCDGTSPADPGPDPGGDPGTDAPDTPAAGLTRGVALSPAGFPTDFSQLNAFFDEVTGFGRGAVMWNGAWRDDAVNGTDAGTIPVAARVVADAAQDGSRFAPVAVFGWRSEDALFLRVPENQVNDWSNDEARASFRNVVRDFASEYRPALLFLGNESDFYAAEDPADYARWIAAYDEAYAAIKAVSPETLVGPIFNVEHMMGWGTFSGWTTPRTEAFTLHDRARVDVVGLTLYPYLGRATPTEVPADYLDPVVALLDGIPIAITETGWPASAPGTAVPWQPGEGAQGAYLSRLGEMLDDRSVLLVNWLFLHPMATASPEVLSTFGTVSLRNEAGGKRPVYDAFVAFGGDG